ncbi:MAG TPA: hypothetical protein VGO93_18205 [Candidatus Xenobia bacterium]
MPPNFSATFTNTGLCPHAIHLCFNPSCSAGIVTEGAGCEFFKDLQPCGSFLSFDVRAINPASFHCGFLPVCARGLELGDGSSCPGPCGEYLVGRCRPTGHCCNFRDFFIFCTSSLAGHGVICSASLVAPQGCFFGACCQPFVLHKVCVPSCALTGGSSQFNNLGGPCIFGTYLVHNKGCAGALVCLPLNACALAVLNADALAGTPFILGGSDPLACCTTGSAAGLFGGTTGVHPVGLDITFKPTAGGAPEVNGSSAARPVALALGLLCLAESRRKK